MGRAHAAATARVAVAGASTAATFGLVTTMTLAAPPTDQVEEVVLAAPVAAPEPAPVAAPALAAPREIVVVRRHRILVPTGPAIPASRPAAAVAPAVVRPAPQTAPRVTAPPTTTPATAAPVAAAPRPRPRPAATSRAS